MTRAHHALPRLHVAAPLQAGLQVPADAAQANYLANVLRLTAGDGVLLFNGRDGEWLAHLDIAGRKSVRLVVAEQTRAQGPTPDVTLCFVPLKGARNDYLVEKAVECGAGALQPVLSQHGQVPKPNLERMQAQAREAAEQCGALYVPDIREPIRLDALLTGWNPATPLLFCDEAQAGEHNAVPTADGPCAILVGPEGGFSTSERTTLTALPFVRPISLGPRILRAETAAVAALVLAARVS